jgi:hypothetical protein
MKLRFLPVCALSCQALFSACGQGYVYDQQSSDENNRGEGVAGIQQLQPIGQSFIPTNSSVNFVRMIFADINPGNNLGAVVYVNLWSGSISDGTLLNSTAPVSLPDSFGFNNDGIVNFFFATSTTLIPGMTYYFQPVVQSGDAWETIADVNFNYSGGTAIFNGTANPQWDLWFREGVYTAVPEPSSVWLVLLGGGVWWLAGCKRIKHVYFNRN